MKSSDEQIDPIMQRKLNALRMVPGRDPGAVERGRARYMILAENLAPENQAKAVSKSEKVRHREWKVSLFNGKEHLSMFAPFVSIMLIASLVLGGTGATVAAAQGSLPDQPLYGVKIWSEEARIELASQAQNQLQLELEYANRRVEEIRAMLGKGIPPQPAVLTRMRNQLDRAFQLAAGLDERQVQPALQQIRQELQAQEQVMAQLMTQAGPQAEPGLEQARQMIQTRLKWAQAGIADPQTFQKQFRQQGPGRYGVQPTDLPQPAPGGYGPGPNAQGSATPGSSYGPGPGINPCCTPTGAGYGPGPGPNSTDIPGNGDGYSPGPYVTGTPTPGSGYGPGTGPNPICTPTGGSYGPGPGGNGDQTPGGGYGPGPQITSTPLPENNGSPTETRAPGNGNGPGMTQAPGSNNGPGPGPEPSSTCTPQNGPGGPQGSGGGGNNP